LGFGLAFGLSPHAITRSGLFCHTVATAMRENQSTKCVDAWIIEKLASLLECLLKYLPLKVWIIQRP